MRRPHEQPAFSVCIPNYNYARYLGTAIQSVLNQTYRLFEIVVVDNASTDDSMAVAESFGAPCISVYRNPCNVGFAANLDRAASRASNPYIIMLSSDDVMRPTALEEYARAITALGEHASHALFASNTEWFDDAGRTVYAASRDSLFRAEPDEDLTRLIGDGSVAVFDGLRLFAQVFPRMKVATPFCTTAYSRELYERVGGYSSLHHTAPDAHFSYKALLHGARVVFVDRPLFGYRVHTSNQFQTDKRQRTLRIPIDHYAFVLQFTDEELGRAGVTRGEAIHALVDETCLRAGLAEVRDGDSYQAFRLLMFALATYPTVALRNFQTYLLAGLLAVTPPIGRRIIRGLYAFHVARRNRLQTAIEHVAT